MRLGGSGDHHAAGGSCGWLRRGWGWLVGNGNGYNITPNIDISDSLALMTLTRWVVCTRSVSRWCRLSDRDRDSLGNSGTARGWWRRNNSDCCWLDCCYWRRWWRIVSRNGIASGGGEVLCGQPGRIISGSRVSCNRSRARHKRSLSNPFSFCNGSPNISGCRFGGRGRHSCGSGLGIGLACG